MRSRKQIKYSNFKQNKICMINNRADLKLAHIKAKQPEEGSVGPHQGGDILYTYLRMESNPSKTSISVFGDA